MKAAWRHTWEHNGDTARERAAQTSGRTTARSALLGTVLLGACSSAPACAGCSPAHVKREHATAAPERKAASKAAPVSPPTPKTTPAERDRAEAELDLEALEKRLRALRRGGKTQVRYLPAEGAEWGIYGDWVAQATRAARTGRDAPPPPRGFAFEARSDMPLWLLHEDPELRRGAGAVVLRAGVANPIVVETPHTFFDEGTLSLSLHAFARLRARALVINTAHRSNVFRDLGPEAQKEAARTGELASDVAHADNSFFTSAHVALCRELTGATTLQLHGFRDEYIGFDIIVSGAKTVFDASPLAAALRAAFPKARIGAYPEDVRDLGGTGNAQAGVSRRYGMPFVHVELSHSMRTRLLEQTPDRARFLDALFDSLGAERRR